MYFFTFLFIFFVFKMVVGVVVAGLSYQSGSL